MPADEKELDRNETIIWIILAYNIKIVIITASVKIAIIIYKILERFSKFSMVFRNFIGWFYIL